MIAKNFTVINALPRNCGSTDNTAVKLCTNIVKPCVIDAKYFKNNMHLAFLRKLNVMDGDELAELSLTVCFI